jgi:hypothetical protein
MADTVLKLLLELEDIDKFVVVCNGKRVHSDERPYTALAVAYSRSQEEEVSTTIRFNERALATIKVHLSESSTTGAWNSGEHGLFNIILRGQRVSIDSDRLDKLIIKDADGNVLPWKLTDDEWREFYDTADFLGIETDYWGYSRTE